MAVFGTGRRIFRAVFPAVLDFLARAGVFFAAGFFKATRLIFFPVVVRTALRLAVFAVAWRGLLLPVFADERMILLFLIFFAMIRLSRRGSSCYRIRYEQPIRDP